VRQENENGSIEFANLLAFVGGLIFTLEDRA
jgi:hypothetical protein